MKTYSFIGSDKNAGKTTAFTAVYQRMQADPTSGPICVTSIGINGEEADSYEGIDKPTIHLSRETFFVTRDEHLRPHTGRYQTMTSFRAPDFSRDYILGRCLTGFSAVLEGPNTGREILRLKESLRQLLPTGMTLLIDGSIDRQFLARPQISDLFFFSILFSSRQNQQQKTRGLLHALSLPPCPEATALSIGRHRGRNKSLLLANTGPLLYHGEGIPSTDARLLEACIRARNERCILYLDGAFTPALHEALAGFGNLDVILDNFSQYLNFSIGPEKNVLFKPCLFLLNPVRIQAMFVKQETDFDPGLLPKNIRVINLFRTDHHEIGI